MWVKYTLISLVSFTFILFFISLFNFKNPINIPGDIEDNIFVFAVGIDKGIDDENNYRLTVISERFSKEEEEKPRRNEITCEGRTILEAVRNFSTKNLKPMFWGHITHVVIGEEIANESIYDIIDFFVRDNKLKLNVGLTIAKGTTAESILRLGETTGEYIPDLINGIYRDVWKKSVSRQLLLLDLIIQIACVGTDVTIPAIRVVSRTEDLLEMPLHEKKIHKEGKKIEESDENGSKQKNSDNKSEENSEKEEKEEKIQISLVLDGYATFKDEKLIGYISERVSRGRNWVAGDVVSGVIVVDDIGEDKISLEIVSAKKNIKIDVNDNKINAHINVEFSTTIDEVISKINFFTKDYYDKLIESQNKIVKEEIEKAVEYAQRNNTDILKICTNVKRQHPFLWKRIKDDWGEIFGDININVNVKSNVRRTYNILQTIDYKE